ncbi:MAG: hypothetical protein JKY48_02465 [Flavobacteriales bacterium]|nr:hypothetical protein [Flavobacteriales bacterium]
MSAADLLPFETQMVKNINKAYELEKDNNREYRTSKRAVSYNSLLPEDIQNLEAQGLSTFTVNFLQPLINQQLKTLHDAAPTNYIDTNTSAPEDKFKAELLTKKLKTVNYENHYADVIYQASENSFVAGKAVIKIKTDYKYKDSFKQYIFYENVEDATTVFFDPYCQKKNKEDAEYVCEIKFITKDRARKLYPIAMSGNGDNKVGLELFSAMEHRDERLQESLVSVVDYYYKKEGNKYKIYQLENDAQNPTQEQKPYIGKPVVIKQEQIDLFFEYHTQVADNTLKFKVDRSYREMDESVKQILLDRVQMGTEITTGKYSPDGQKIVSERTQTDTSIKRCRFVNNSLVEKEKPINFDGLPFVYIPGNDQYIDGKNKILPYAKNAMDAQRIANLILNLFCSEAFNNRTGTYMTPNGSVDKETLNAMKKPYEKNVIVYNQYSPEFKDSMNGQPLPLNPPTYMQAPPLPTDYVGVVASMYETATKILGSNMMSLDQATSGEHLYKLSEYVSAAIEPYVQNLLQSLTQLGRLILGGLRRIETNEMITLKRGGEEKQHMLDYNFPAHHFNVRVERGVSYKLQQDATVERLIKLAQASPPFAQWLYSQGMPMLMQNMQFNNKADIIGEYETFMQEQAQQSQKPNPEAQALQVTSQARMMDAQAKMMDANTKQQQGQLNAHKMQQEMQMAELDGVIKLRSQNLKEEEMESQNHRTAATIWKDIHNSHVKEDELVHKKAMELIREMKA